MRFHLALPLLGLAASLPAQLAGAYVVGPGGSFANMAAAISALTTGGVIAPVSFLVTANDTGPWSIGAIPGQGPTRPILFDGQGTVTISGTQPVLTLNGCDSVTFRGFNGTFTNTTNSFVISGTTANCVFTNCNFTATVATGGVALFNFSGGTGCRIEDSTFGGGYEALNSGVGNAMTTVQRCRIIGGGFWIMRLAGSDFTLVDNFITGTSNYGISAGASGAANGPNLRILHNSVFINHPSSSSQYCSLRWYSSAAGTEVVDNIFYDAYPSTANYNMWCSGSIRPSVMDYNCFWSNIAGYFPVSATGNQTLATWQALGFDTNSISADPMYVAPSASPADLRLMPGSPCSIAGNFLPSVTTDFFQSMRVPPVSIGAHEEVGGIGASYAVFGGGCAGSAGVASNTAWPPPSLGATAVVTFANLPTPEILAMVLGVSNTTSALGALPLHLAPFGGPGCSLRTSIDMTTFLVGSNGSASFNLVVPNLAQLIGFHVYTQGFVLDPAANAIGGVTSDAAVATVGL